MPISEQEAASKFLQRVKAILPAETDPAMMKSLVDRLHLEEVIEKDENLAAFFKAVKSEPKSTALFIETVEKALLANVPLCKLLATIEKKELVSDQELQEAAPLFTLQLNMLYLLEAFAVTMQNSNSFNKELCNSLIKERMGHHPMTNMAFMDKSLGVFKRLKLVSIDPAFISSAFYRSLGGIEDTAVIDEAVKAFQLEYGLTAQNANIHPGKADQLSYSSTPGCALNIIEAMWEESAKNPANAMAGAGLIVLMEQQGYLDKSAIRDLVLPAKRSLDEKHRYDLLPDLKVNTDPKRIKSFEVSKEWMDLYGAWNLKFVLANIDQEFMPLKLLVPSVIAAEPEHYLESRTLMLFLFANLYVNNKLDKNPLFVPLPHFEKGKEILERFGQINQNYADALIVTQCPPSTPGTKEAYQAAMGKSTTYSLFYHLANYAMYPDSFHITKEAKVADNQKWQIYLKEREQQNAKKALEKSDGKEERAATSDPHSLDAIPASPPHGRVISSLSFSSKGPRSAEQKEGGMSLL